MTLTVSHTVVFLRLIHILLHATAKLQSLTHTIEGVWYAAALVQPVSLGIVARHAIGALAVDVGEV